eukprot:4783607-Amphidinium_carterae.1
MGLSQHHYALIDAANYYLSGAESVPCQAASGLTDAHQVTLPCFATQVGIDGHRDAQPTIASWNRPIEVPISGLPTTPPEDQDIPPGPKQRKGQPASDHSRTAQQTTSQPPDAHSANSATEVVSQGSNASPGALSSCVSICHSYLLLMPSSDSPSDTSNTSGENSSSSGYIRNTMKQDQTTAKAAAPGTAKQQAQPDFRTPHQEATGKSQGAKSKPQTTPDHRTQHKEERWAVSIPQATPAHRKTLRKASTTCSPRNFTNRSTSNSTSSSPSSESTPTSTCHRRGNSTRAVTHNAKQQAQPDFRTPHQEATGKSQGA